MRDFEIGPAWSNPQSASRLELQLQFAEKASYTSNHASQTMDGCQLFYKEIIVPQRMEAQFKPKNRSVEIVWNQVEDVVTVANTEKNLDISALLSSGNIRQFTLRCQTAAQRTGPTKDVLATTRPTKLALKINGQKLFELEDETLKMQQLLQKYKYFKDETSPLSYSFCANPGSKDTSGYLPSSNDKMVLVLTPDNTRLDCIVELEKIFTRGPQGRITKSDS